MTKLGIEQKNVTKITKAGLCTGCGMCQVVCPEQAIEINLLDRGWFQAQINEKLCSNCGLCLKICGRNHEDDNTKSQKYREQDEYTRFLGYYDHCYLGHSTDINIRWNAASGGVITSILAFCFKKHLIDCAIVASSNTENPLISQAIVATSIEEILQSCGSRYAPIAINVAIKQALNLGKKIAVVGLPCHIRSLKKAGLLLPELKNKLVLSLGMFCSHNVSLKAVDFVLLHRKIRKNNVSEFDYRGKGWPSGIRIKAKHGRTAYISNSNSVWTKLFSSFIYAPSYCLSCTDQTNELADISFGDAWIPEVVKHDRIGRTICLARTEIGSSVLQQATQDKAIKLIEIEPEKVIKSQAWPLYFKKINVLCRKSLYPEHTIQVDASLSKHHLAFSDYFVNYFAQFSSAVSNWMTINKYSSYITARLLLLLAKAYNKILLRRTEELMNRFLKPRQSSMVQQSPIVTDRKNNCTNIVIVNQHGNNRGDEAALRGMLYGLGKLIPNARFTVFTIHPAKDFQHVTEAEFFDTVVLVRGNVGLLAYLTFAALLHRLGLQKFSKLFRKKSCFMESLKAADIVVSAPGGPYFGDIYRGLEPTCALPIYIAKLLGKPTMIYGPSQGPFDNELRNRWRKWLLSRVDCIAVREKFSKVYLENLGINTSSVYVTADSCLQKPVDPLLKKNIIQKEGIDTNKMLIGVVPLNKIPSSASNKLESLDVQKMAVRTIILLGEMFDAEFILIPQMHGTYTDVPVMEQIAWATGLNKRIRVLPDSYNSDQQQSLIGACNVFISFRYHPFIFSARQAVPCICVAYEHKAFGFAQSINLEEYCLDLFSTTPEEIAEKVKKTWANKNEFTKCAISGIKKLEELSFNNSKLTADMFFRFSQKTTKS